MADAVIEDHDGDKAIEKWVIPEKGPEKGRQKVGENGSRVWYNKMRFVFFAGSGTKMFTASGAERDYF